MSPLVARGLALYLLGSALVPASALAQVTPLLPAGSDWKFLRDGEIPSSNFWRYAEFDDNNWSAGKAPLGFGDADIATDVGFGKDPNKKPMSHFFRRQFEVPHGTSFSYVLLRVQRDDGALIYLNGNELVRTAMPSGAVSPTTSSSEVAAGETETTFFEFPFSAKRLKPGTNQLSVEVHQHEPNSSDLRFDLELLGVTGLDSYTLQTRPQGWYADERSAFGAAFLLNAPVVMYFVDGTAEVAGRFETQTFSFKPIADGLNANFVRLRVDTTAPGAAEMIRQKGIDTIPTVIFADMYGREISRSPGFLDYQLMERAMQQALLK